ncbi:hypothetical protein GCM10019993_16960 [Enterococcus pseudoavium]
MELPPLKFAMNDHVQFRVAETIFTGVIEDTELSCSSQRNYHSYNIFVKERECSFLHVPEFDVLRKY